MAHNSLVDIGWYLSFFSSPSYAAVAIMAKSFDKASRNSLSACHQNPQYAPLWSCNGNLSITNELYVYSKEHVT